MRERFFVKYCPSGHMVYAIGQDVSQEHCEKCGGTLLSNCPKCESPIPNTFVAFYLSALGRPSSFPRPPQFCANCGGMFPWTEKEHKKIEKTGIWSILHPDVAAIARRRFETGHYADAVEAAFKQINSRVKKIYQKKTGIELDGVALMRKAFTPSGRVIVLDNLESETGRNIQQGYMEIFSGSISAIRNPKAHDNIDITAERCIHFLTVASLLLRKLEERIEP